MAVVSSPPRVPSAPPMPERATAPRAEPEPPPADARFVLPGAALMILSALLLGFVASLTVVGHLQHARAQQTGYAELRKQLAYGTAPVGQTDYEGALLSPGDPVAILRISGISVREVVFEGSSSGVLMKGPGHRRDTVLPGQPGTSVLMGRQYAFGGPFQNLHRLGEGDRIEVTTGQGEHVYQVTGLRYPGDPLPAAAAEGQGRLTLVTATGGPYTPSEVLRVDAELVSDVYPAPSPEIPIGSFSDAEDVLAGDDGALIPILLWSQALLLAAVVVSWAHRRWGRWQAWITGFPVLSAIALALSGELARLMPNLM